MHFRFEQTVPLPRDVVFAFHENPDHLPLIHCGWSRFRLIRHEGGLQTGNRLWVETTVAGILPIVLGFVHTEHDPPRAFAERLFHGPFRVFTHRHEFHETADGAATVVRDVLEIALPWWYGGEAATRIFLAPMIRRAFQCRGAALREVLRR